MGEVKEIDVEGSETNILYTICDAEFTSDKEFQDTFAKLNAVRGGAGVSKCYNYVLERINKIKKRDGFLLMDTWQVLEQIIADQSAK